MEAIKNPDLPAIEIYCADEESEGVARAVGYGIEEEGLPYYIIKEAISREAAWELTKAPGLGVVVLAWERNAAVFTRQLKTMDSLFHITRPAVETARAVGKNAARIVKNKPFIDLDELK